ncbi:MAG: twin-arginine translocation signal domain-containing protein, partial [Xanthobacteraceae bacterium]|nr:twin-arginine translocation signal domain-containing protein [Xanthobacteraceae bacterium]
MQPLSRRDVLQAAAVLTTTASVTAINPSLALAEDSSGAKPASLAQIDA